MRKLRFKNLQKSLLLRLVAVVTFAISFAIFSFWIKQNTSNNVIYVKIPPIFNEKQTDTEIRQEWLDYGFVTVPHSEIRKRKLWTAPYPPIFIVSIENDGKLKFTDDYLEKIQGYIPQEDMGSLENTDILKRELKSILHHRTVYDIYEEDSSKVVKKVMIRAPRSAKYGDVVKIIDAVKESGADPVILQIDELPQ